MICWSFGDQLYWTGTRLDFDNVAIHTMELLAFGDLINHHARLLIPASVALAALGSMGAMTIGHKRRWIPLAILIEMMMLSPVSPILNVTSSTTPDVLHEIDELPPGPLLMLPIEGPGVHFQRQFLDQRIHGRTLVADPQSPGLPAGIDSSWRNSDSARWLIDLAHCDSLNIAPHHRCEPPESFEPPPEVILLYAPIRFVEDLRVVLGAPTLEGRDGAVWSTTSEY